MRLAFALIAFTDCHRESAPATNVPARTLNERVLALLDEYPTHGFGGYTWPAPAGTAGTTRDLRLTPELRCHSLVEPAAVEGRALGIAACLELGRCLDLERALRARVAVDPEEALVVRASRAQIAVKRSSFASRWPRTMPSVVATGPACA